MPTKTKHAISVKSLTAGYPGRTILENVSFDVEKGSILTVLGTSGCGKSTLLKHMCGLIKPISGDILLHNKSIVKAEGADYIKLCANFGVAFQGGALFRSLTLEQNVALPLEAHSRLSKKDIAKKVAEKLELVNLGDFADFLPSELSGGMIKRAAFARAMALDPDILFFDEPSAGLDPVSSDALDKLVLDIRSKTGATIVIVTHELASIFAVSDRSIMLSKEEKNIIADGPPLYLRDHSDHPRVREFLNRGRIEPNIPKGS